MKIPGRRFERVAAAFQDGGRVKLCESSGSEHSPDNSMDLSDLVKSFMESSGVERDDHDGEEIFKQGLGDDQEGSLLEEHSMNCFSYREARETLENLFGSPENDGDCDLQLRIQTQAETACSLIGDRSSEGFKRRLMTHFRERGFDAGLCKSKWERTGRLPAGNYEYVDVIIGGNRYIVEVLLAREFEIARPADDYKALLESFPAIFIGKVEKLKEIVKVMSAMMKRSLKTAEIHVPPWRSDGYMQAKWFGSFRRTTNQVWTSTKLLSPEEISANRSLCFTAFPAAGVSYSLRGGFNGKCGMRTGYLAAAFNSNGDNGVIGVQQQ